MTDAPKLQRSRAELAQLRARHDSGAVSPAVYAVIRTLEEDVAWNENQQGDAEDQK